MAKINEYFLEFKCTSGFNRVPITCIENQWYIISGKNSVTKIQDSKSIHTWTLQPSFHYFTSHVAYFKEVLYSVIDETILLKWSVEDKSLENAEKVKFQEEVHSIIHVPGAEPIVIFQSGKFVVVDSIAFCHLTPLESIKLKDGDCLEWADVAVSVTTFKMFYLTFNKKNKQRTLYHFSVNKEDKTVSPPVTFYINHENASFKACCLNREQLLFFSLWSDGTLRCYNVKDSSDKVVLSTENVTADTIMDICCINFNHNLIAKGTPKNKECLLEIWDIEVAILKGSRTVKAPELTFFKISAVNDYIFLNFACDKLLAISYFLTSSFTSTYNASKCEEFQQIEWDSNLKVKQIPFEDESMDVSFSDPSSLDTIEELIEKFQNEDAFNLEFISEAELIKVLQLVIRHKKSNQNDLNKDVYILLNIIFSASFNNALLIKYLKYLNLEDILVTLDFLLKYLKHSFNMPMDMLHKPSDLQVMNWICLVISSHTETLLFTKDKAIKKLLKNLKKILSIRIQEFEDLEGLQSYLSVCCHKNHILPQQYSLEKYCFEKLE